MHGEEGLPYATTVADDRVERVPQAAPACPVQTVHLGEEVSGGAR
ncbi:hypothetical protein [Streptomyces sp. NBC_01378]